MKTKNLSYYKIRTDLIDDVVVKKSKSETKYKDIKVSSVSIDKVLATKIKKKEGSYTTIYFNDITDKNNFYNTQEILVKELKKILRNEHIKKGSFCLVVGLGNEKSTPDSLGVKTCEKVIVTKHLYDIFGKLEKGYTLCSSFNPGVMGTTGIEVGDILKSIVKFLKPDYLIVIDALASGTVDRLCKTIQISTSGINPGSGIGNKRKEVSKEVIGIPVIAIGVPMVVDATTIIYDSVKDKKALKNIKYIDNLIVTPTEIDFLVEKLSTLISNSINMTIHNI